MQQEKQYYINVYLIVVGSRTKTFFQQTVQIGIELKCF